MQIYIQYILHNIQYNVYIYNNIPYKYIYIYFFYDNIYRKHESKKLNKKHKNTNNSAFITENH